MSRLARLWATHRLLKNLPARFPNWTWGEHSRSRAGISGRRSPVCGVQSMDTRAQQAMDVGSEVNANAVAPLGHRQTCRHGGGACLSRSSGKALRAADTSGPAGVRPGQRPARWASLGGFPERGDSSARSMSYSCNCDETQSSRASTGSWPRATRLGETWAARSHWPGASLAMRDADRGPANGSLHAHKGARRAARCTSSQPNSGMTARMSIRTKMKCLISCSLFSQLDGHGLRLAGWLPVVRALLATVVAREKSG